MLAVQCTITMHTYRHILYVSYRYSFTDLTPISFVQTTSLLGAYHKQAVLVLLPVVAHDTTIIRGKTSIITLQTIPHAPGLYPCLLLLA